MALKYFIAGLGAGLLTIYFAPNSNFVFNPKLENSENILVKSQNFQNLPKIKIGLQIGHLDQDKVPPELSALNSNFENKFLQSIRDKEISITREVAKELLKILEQEGFSVDLLSATVPEGYLADAFLSLHLDWNKNQNVRGFKVSGSAFDSSGKSQRLAELIKFFYEKITLLPWNNYITPNMRYYYAFNYKSFKHSISPETPAAIIELGFLTNKEDYEFLKDHPQKAAQALAKGLIAFIKNVSQF